MIAVKTEQFEGPLSLLLQLIEQEKLDITRVSLAQVTDQYLEYMNSKQNVTLENLSQFLTVASRLILIKSKALLPLLEFTEEEEQEIRDFEHQLALYKKFKDASTKIAEILSEPKACVARENFLDGQPFFCPPEDIKPQDLFDALRGILRAIPAAQQLEEETMREVITLEEKIEHLQTTLRERVHTSFAEIVANTTDRVEIVVSFLAMLELVKQKIIHVEQGELFSEIKMKHHESANAIRQLPDKTKNDL